MDSLRSLNASLPAASPAKQQASEPPEQLLQAFKAAALSVTKLYKTAAADQGRARSEGYQDALDDLLSFLDKENIGLSDGEGWRIRRWATERLDGRDSVPVESDDEIVEKPPADRASSPVVPRSQSATRASTKPTRTASPARMESAPPTIPPQPEVVEQLPNMVPPQSSFTFRSAQAYPQDTDMGLSSLDLSDSNRSQSHESSHASNMNPGITLTRPTRASARHNNSNRTARTSSTIGRGAGQKRKINLGEFFDIGNIGPKDGFGGGGKRGRFV